jgi:hypothetical protein
MSLRVEIPSRREGGSDHLRRTGRCSRRTFLAMWFLPAKWVEEVQDFFVNYHGLEGKKYKLLGCKGEEVAFRLIKDAQKAA